MFWQLSQLSHTHTHKRLTCSLYLRCLALLPWNHPHFPSITPSLRRRVRPDAAPLSRLPPRRPSLNSFCAFLAGQHTRGQAADPGTRQGCRLHAHRHGWLTTWKTAGALRTMPWLYGTFMELSGWAVLASVLEQDTESLPGLELLFCSWHWPPTSLRWKRRRRVSI